MSSQVTEVITVLYRVIELLLEELTELYNLADNQASRADVLSSLNREKTFRIFSLEQEADKLKARLDAIGEISEGTNRDQQDAPE